MPAFNAPINDIMQAIQAADAQYARMQQQKMGMEQLGLQQQAGARAQALQSGILAGQQTENATAAEKLRQMQEMGKMFGGGAGAGFEEQITKLKTELGEMKPEETALFNAGVFHSKAKRDPAPLQQAVSTIMTQRGQTARDNPTVETPHTVTTGKGVYQWNPQTKKFDIYVGPPNRQDAGLDTSNLRGDELDKLPPQQLAIVKGIANYELDLKSLSYRGGSREKYMGLAKLYDPTFDQTQYAARQSARRDFTSGKSANNIRSLNTVVGHLDSLKKASDALDNAPVKLWNMIANQTLSQTGDSRVVRFNAAANAVESELANVFKGMGATDQEIKAWREQLSSSQSPEQLHGAIDQLIDLIASRMNALDSQYRVALGKPKDFRILNDTSRKILEKMGGSAQALLDADQTIGGNQTNEVQEFDYVPGKGLVPRKPK